MPNTWLRINGIGHAFSRELGCDCGRCRTVNMSLVQPGSIIESFPGWDDPPWRAHTSGSILISDASGKVVSHILIDAGAGVVDSLVCSNLSGLDHLTAFLITHWHPDHVLGMNQLCESLRRAAKEKGRSFEKVPVYCTLATYDSLRGDKGLSYEFNRFLAFREILPGHAFEVAGAASVKLTPIHVAHSGIKGAVVFVAEVNSKKVVFCWDLDIPEAPLPAGGLTNQQVFQDNVALLKNADILFLAANTWAAAGTGHTSYTHAREYIRIIEAKSVYLVHLSGHEDRPGNPGYGWSDSAWAAKVQADGVLVARQGMVLPLGTA